VVGKDSSVMVQLANIIAKKYNKKFDILYIDLEAQYSLTIQHIYELKQLSQVRDFYHIALPLALRNAVSILQPKWICWERASKNLWVRDLPKDSINISNCPFPWFKEGEEFEDFIIQFANWYQKKWGGRVACGVGIRTDESLNRFRTITFQTNKTTFKNKNWTTKISMGENYIEVFNFYPIYDWSTEDIWGAVSKLDLKYNQIYELMYKNGLNIHEQRLCQPYGDDQRNGLDQFKALEYETWEKVVNRVNGVNFGNIYCRTTALGNLKSSKPKFMTWKEYTIFLLESIGIYNSDLMLHYYRKIKKFAYWYKKRDNIDIPDIPDEANSKLENQKKVISWRRIARAIEKNDFYMKRLCFAQTKTDNEELKRLIHKWDNLLTKDTISDDKDLINFIENEVIEDDFKND
jgi:predicted phosphoadenosine phosphosulfate sulfurtransferase